MGFPYYLNLHVFQQFTYFTMLLIAHIIHIYGANMHCQGIACTRLREQCVLDTTAGKQMS
jgi:hypothetical protein